MYRKSQPVQDGSLILFAPENVFLQKVMCEGAVLSELLPDGSTPEAIIRTLRLCASVDGEVRALFGWIAPMIGKCMAMAAKNPETYKSLGYKTLRDFEHGELHDKGVSRSTIWQAKRVYECFGEELPVQEFMAAGTVNLATAAQLLPPNASDGQKAEALADAKSMPAAKFKTEYEKKYSHDPGTSSFGQIKVTGNRAQADQVQAYFDDVRAQEWAGSSHPMMMLTRLIEECRIEYELIEEPGEFVVLQALPVEDEDEGHTEEPPMIDDAARDW